jgi:hypothetical protein
MIEAGAEPQDITARVATRPTVFQEIFSQPACSPSGTRSGALSSMIFPILDLSTGGGDFLVAPPE